jgi:hypothetical protein
MAALAAAAAAAAIVSLYSIALLVKVTYSNLGFVFLIPVVYPPFV